MIVMSNFLRSAYCYTFTNIFYLLNYNFRLVTKLARVVGILDYYKFYAESRLHISLLYHINSLAYAVLKVKFSQACPKIPHGLIQENVPAAINENTGF